MSLAQAGAPGTQGLHGECGSTLMDQIGMDIRALGPLDVLRSDARAVLRVAALGLRRVRRAYRADSGWMPSESGVP